MAADSDPVAGAELRQGLQQFLAGAIELVGAERGLILTPIQPAQDYDVVAVQNFVEAPDQVWLGAQISQTIIRRVGNTKEPVLSRNAVRDARFQDVTSVVVSGLRSVLAVPILVDGKLWGVLYVDNNLETSAFKPEHLDQLYTFTDRVSDLVKMAR